MYEIIKVLNNNTLLAIKGKNKVIFLGKGIGFKHKTGDLIEENEEWEKYIFHEENTHPLDPFYIDVASKLMDEAEEKFIHVDKKIILPLSDHLQFSMTRLKEGLEINNPFKMDIKLLYPDEYEIALKAQEFMNYPLPIDEIGYIALHIHSSLTSIKTSQTLQVMECIRNNIEKLREDLHIKIEEDSLSYQRLMNHLKFLLLRINNGEKLEVDINEFTKMKFPFAYDIAIKLCKDIENGLDKTIPENEVGYLALHIERILSLEIK